MKDEWPWRDRTRGEKLRTVAYIAALLLLAGWFVYAFGLPGV